MIGMWFSRASAKAVEIHDPQMLLNRLLVTEFLVTLGLRVFLGVRGVDPIHIGGLEHGLAFEFRRAQHGGGVGGEIRIAGPGGQQHDAALAEIFHRALAVIGLADRGHGQRRQRARLAPRALDGGLQHQAIHHRRQHAHGVADRPRHAALGHFDAAEDIAAAHHHAEFDAERCRRRQIRSERLDRRLIDAEILARR